MAQSAQPAQGRTGAAVAFAVAISLAAGWLLGLSGQAMLWLVLAAVALVLLWPLVSSVAVAMLIYGGVLLAHAGGTAAGLMLRLSAPIRRLASRFNEQERSTARRAFIFAWALLVLAVVLQMWRARGSI